MITDQSPRLRWQPTRQKARMKWKQHEEMVGSSGDGLTFHR
jgi:hypothetical protein